MTYIVSTAALNSTPTDPASILHGTCTHRPLYFLTAEFYTNDTITDNMDRETHTHTSGHRLSTVGRRAFAVHGPMVWNSLPDDLRAQQDYI